MHLQVVQCRSVVPTTLSGVWFRLNQQMPLLLLHYRSYLGIFLISLKIISEICQSLTLLSLQIVIRMKQNSSHRESHHQTAHTLMLWIITGVEADVPLARV